MVSGVNREQIRLLNQNRFHEGCPPNSSSGKTNGFAHTYGVRDSGMVSGVNREQIRLLNQNRFHEGCPPNSSSGKTNGFAHTYGVRDLGMVSGVSLEQIRLFKLKEWVERSPRLHFFINHEIHESGKEAGE